MAGQPKVGQDLRFVDRQDLLHCLEFDNELTLDDQVDAVAAIQPVSPVVQRQRHLPIVGNSVPGQLEPEAFFIGRLQQAWTKLSVNGNGRADDPPRQAPQLVFSAPSAPLR
jgi:hypothetical protein